ncbi:hypothetical protein JXR93_14575, partial [bacterium]|nr:hypothetical protein [bacterium]
KIDEGEFIKYKGRVYCWLSITTEGKIVLTENILSELSLKKGDKLLSIRGSNIAFVMGVKGPLIEKGNNFEGEIKEF